MGILETTHFKLIVSDATENLHYWASNEKLSEETRHKIMRADIVIVPWDYQRERGPTFPDGTTELFKALQKVAGQNAIAIASDPEGYHELALHSDERRWPTLLLTYAAIPLAITLIGAQIDRAMHAPKPPATIEMSLTIDNQNGRCIKIDYKGPPKDLVKSFEAQIANCFPDVIKTEPKDPSGPTPIPRVKPDPDDG